MAPRTVWRERWPQYSAKSGSIGLGPTVIRFSTSDTYPTKNRKNAENANREGGASFVFGPLNRYVPLVKGHKKAVSGGKMVDLGGVKNKRRATFVIGVFCHFSVFRRIGVTCAKSNHDRSKTHLGAIFLVLLKHTFDGFLGAP